MLNTYKFEGSRNSGASNWFLQRMTGILLVVVFDWSLYLNACNTG